MNCRPLGVIRMTNAKQNRTMCIMFVLLCIGFLLKIRNTANTLETAGSSGGLWNIVAIIIYGYWFWGFIQKKSFTYNATVGFGVVFSLLALLNSFANATSFSVSFLYNCMTIFYFLIIFSVFRDFGEKTDLSKTTLNVYTICGLIIGVFVLYHILLHYNNPSVDMYVITDVYYALNMVPLVLMSKNKLLKNGHLILTAVLLILSGKRTGFISFLLGMLVYYLVTAHCGEAKVGQKHNKEKQKKNSFVLLKIVFIGIALLGIFVYLTQRFELDLYERLIIAFEEGESGRDRIWSKIFEAMNNASLGEWLFGHGIKTVPILVGSKNALAHCDYLEILYDYGIGSLIAYIGFQLSIIFKTLALIIKKEPMAANLAFCVVIYIIMSFFSNYVIDATYITYNMITIGLIYGLVGRKTKNE